MWRWGKQGCRQQRHRMRTSSSSISYLISWFLCLYFYNFYNCHCHQEKSRTPLFPLSCIGLLVPPMAPSLVWCTLFIFTCLLLCWSSYCSRWCWQDSCIKPFFRFFSNFSLPALCVFLLPFKAAMGAPFPCGATLFCHLLQKKIYAWMASNNWLPRLLFFLWHIDLPPLQGDGHCCVGAPPVVVLFVKPGIFPLSVIIVSVDTPGLS